MIGAVAVVQATDRDSGGVGTIQEGTGAEEWICARKQQNIYNRNWFWFVVMGTARGYAVAENR